MIVFFQTRLGKILIWQKFAGTWESDFKPTWLDFKYYVNHSIFIRSSRPEVFLEKDVLKICSKFTGEHPCRSVISIKLQSNFIEIVLLHECSPVNLLHIFRRTPKEFFLKNKFFSIFSKEHLRTAASFLLNNVLSKSWLCILKII